MSMQAEPGRMGVLRELPPLLPQFLQRRRVGAPIVAELVAALNIERYLLFVLLRVDTVQSSYAGQGVTPAEMRAYDPYQVIDDISGPLAQLETQGLVTRSAEGDVTLSAEGRSAVDWLHTEATRYVAARTVLPDEELRKLADELRRAANALAENPALTRGPGSHFVAFQAMSRFGDQASPMVQIEQAVGELWGARDDVYTATWRATDMEGPPLDVLAHIWSGAGTVTALCDALRIRQNPEDIESSLAWLVEREYAERDGDSVSLTPSGVVAREDIESETDRVYFDGWPQTKAEAEWMRQTLSRLVAALAPNLQPASDVRKADSQSQ